MKGLPFALSFRFSCLKNTLELLFHFSKKLSMQQDVANAFIKNFQLTQSELTILHGPSREAPITNEFFAVTDRVQVRKNHSLFHLVFINSYIFLFKGNTQQL